MVATRNGFVGLAVVAVAMGQLATACGTRAGGAAQTVEGAGEDAGVDAGVASPAGDGSPARPSAGDAATPYAFLRVAQLSPDLPAIDICAAPHGTAGFQGPLVAQLASADAGADSAAPGLGYAQVSGYVALSAGQYDLRIVAAGAPDCSASLAGTAGDAGSADAGSADGGVDAVAGIPDKTHLPPLAPNAYATLLIAGELWPTGGERGFTVVTIADDSVLAGGAASLRAVHAMPGAPALDFGLGSSATQWTPLFTGVGFATASMRAGPSAGAVDPDGYLPIAPLSAQAVSGRASSRATGDAALANAVTIDPGAIATVFAIGKAGDAAHPPALLFCTDNAPSGGILSDCGVGR